MIHNHGNKVFSNWEQLISISEAYLIPKILGVENEVSWIQR